MHALIEVNKIVYFNPLPRKEGDFPIQNKNHPTPGNFNPLPRKEGDVCGQPYTGSRNDFNPLPRKEGDRKAKRHRYRQSISIHSLVKRETQAGLADIASIKISIHSLVKRETNRLSIRSIWIWNFNPLPRKEGDKV